jgi:hypothetical protein
MKTIRLQQTHKDKIIKICEKLFPQKLMTWKEIKEKVPGQGWAPTGERKLEFKDDALEYGFVWEDYGKPRTTTPAEILHVIIKKEEQRIDGQVLVGVYAHEYFHWFEFVMQVLIPIKYKDEIRKFGKGHLRTKQIQFLDRDVDFIDIMYYELYQKTK